MGVEDQADVGAAQGGEAGELVGQPAAPVVELLAAHARKQRVQHVVAVDDIGVVIACRHVVRLPRESRDQAPAGHAPDRAGIAPPLATAGGVGRGGSAALTTRLVEEQGRGHAHVEAAHRTLHGDRGELVAGAAHQRTQAAPLGAEHERHAAAEIERVVGATRGALGSVDPRARLLDLPEKGDHVRHVSDIQVFGRAGRGFDRGRRDRGRTMPGQHEAAGPGRQGTAGDRPEIAGIGDFVEHDEQLTGEQGVGRHVGIVAYQAGGALVVAAAGELLQLARRDGLDLEAAALHADTVVGEPGEPFDGGGQPCGRRFAPPAQASRTTWRP